MVFCAALSVVIIALGVWAEVILVLWVTSK